MRTCRCVQVKSWTHSSELCYALFACDGHNELSAPVCCQYCELMCMCDHLLPSPPCRVSHYRSTLRINYFSEYINDFSDHFDLIGCCCNSHWLDHCSQYCVSIQECVVGYADSCSLLSLWSPTMVVSCCVESGQWEEGKGNCLQWLVDSSRVPEIAAHAWAVYSWVLKGQKKMAMSWYMPCTSWHRAVM